MDVAILAVLLGVAFMCVLFVIRVIWALSVDPKMNAKAVILNESTRELTIKRVRDTGQALEGRITVTAPDGTHVSGARNAWVRVRRSWLFPFGPIAQTWYLMRYGDPVPLVLKQGFPAIEGEREYTSKLLESVIASRISDRVLHRRMDWRMIVIFVLGGLLALTSIALAYGAVR